MVSSVGRRLGNESESDSGVNSVKEVVSIADKSKTVIVGESVDEEVQHVEGDGGGSGGGLKGGRSQSRPEGDCGPTENPENQIQLHHP